MKNILLGVSTLILLFFVFPLYTPSANAQYQCLGDGSNCCGTYAGNYCDGTGCSCISVPTDYCPTLLGGGVCDPSCSTYNTDSCTAAHGGYNVGGDDTGGGGGGGGGSVCPQCSGLACTTTPVCGGACTKPGTGEAVECGSGGIQHCPLTKYVGSNGLYCSCAPQDYTLPCDPQPTCASGFVCDDPTNKCKRLLSISGTVFVDKIKDQHWDQTAENAYTLSQSTVKIYNSSHTLINTLNTNTGAYTTGATLLEGDYTVEYSSKPAGYDMSTPAGSPPSFAVHIGTNCAKGGSLDGQCDAPGNITDLNIGITNLKPWIQACGMNMRLDNGLSNPIPSTSSCGTYAELSCSSTTPGIVMVGSSDLSSAFGEGQASSTNWQIGGSYPETFTPANPGVIRTSYEYLTTTATQNSITINDLSGYCGAGGIASCVLSASLPNGVYNANGDLVLNAASGTYTFGASSNFVILVKGNLTINTKITVPVGSTTTFSASGNITVDPSIGQSAASCSTASPDLQGYFSADKDFIVSGTNNNCTGIDKQLIVAGAIVANAALGGNSFQNQRNICEQNLNYPTLRVINRLDFVINAPAFLKHPNFVWQEVAP